MMPPSPSEPLYPMSECHWEKVEHNSPGIDGLVHQIPVALSVVFSNDNRNLFSAVHIILCCSKDIYDKKWKDWGIWDLGSSVKAAESGAQVNLSNPSPLDGDITLPKCTVVFEMIDQQPSTLHPIWFGSTLRASQDLRVAHQDSVHILFDRELPLLPDTHVATFYFITHFIGPCALVDLPRKPQALARHFVEILPLTTPRQIPYKELPVEILLHIFQYIAEASQNSGWRRDLLSSALVCRQWRCSLDFLLWDLHIPYSHSHRATSPLDIHLLTRVVMEQPVLARTITHLNTEYFQQHLPFSFGLGPVSLPSFSSSLVSILRSARNLQTLELKCFDVSHMEALGNALCDLHALHTFSTGQVGSYGAISIVQLAYCLASWPSLKSLRIHCLQPPALNKPPMPLQPPACALTELYLEGVFITDEEFIYFLAPSFKTLERVSLDRISVSNDALRVFLEGISQNVSNLMLSNVGSTHPSGADERALDATIVLMPCLTRLFVKGNVATELMVSRRASLFGTSSGSSLPIIQLSFDLVSGLPVTIADGEWPGWDIRKPYMGPRCGGVQRAYGVEQFKALQSRPEGYLKTIKFACHSGGFREGQRRDNVDGIR